SKSVKAAQIKPAKPKKTTGVRLKASATKKSVRRRTAPAGRADGGRVAAEISRRIREIRVERFGDQGGPELARRLGLPARPWYNYETGVTVPAEVLLGFLAATGAEPWWVLKGEGPRYRHATTGG